MSDESPDATRAVLAANESFYRAFATRNFELMEQLWATTVPVTCIHPGWNAVQGRDPVVASWRSILSSPNAPAIVPAAATAHILNDVAYVICEERIDGAVLIATNIFVREEGTWRLTHHHAGQVLSRVPVPVPPGGDHSVN